MAYCFEKHFELRGNHDEDLAHVPEFKKKIDNIVKNSKKIVCIGWRPDTGYVLYDYLTAFAQVIIVEAWESSVSQFKHPSCRIMHGDGLTLLDTAPDTFDTLIWQDGPEHCDLEKITTFVSKAKLKVNAIIFATPNGHFPQGAYMGNPWEHHISTWSKDTYTSLGFNSTEYIAKTHNSPDKTQGLIGYWMKS